MKAKILISLLILLSVGCENENNKKVIYSKDYKTDENCVCNYHYDNGYHSIWFQDSCNKYNIGDTIK